MGRRSLFAWVCALLFAMPVPVAVAAATTTVQRTIQDCDGDNLLDLAPGEPHVEWNSFASEAGCSGAGGDPIQLPRKASILNFLQLSDFQMVDEESPARVEWLDATQRTPGLQPFSAAYRPQESLTTQVTEAMVRQARNATSPVTGQPLELTILTGDNADSQQYNETRWFIDILDGTDHSPNRIDPDSGVPAPGCEATPGSIYDGVRASGRSGVAPDGGYYEPDGSDLDRDDGDGYSPIRQENLEETPGRDVTVRDFPNLFERANEPFEAVGLDMPWYSAFGNHDALVQGNSPDAYFGPFGLGPVPPPDKLDAPEVFDPALQSIATGCAKIMQPPVAVMSEVQQGLAEIGRLREGGLTPAEQLEVDRLTGAIQGTALRATVEPCDPEVDEGCSVEVVPPDPKRCFLAKDEREAPPPPGPCAENGWIGEHFETSGEPDGHGFQHRPPAAQANDDGYYAFSPKPGVRFVVLDTVTDECGTPFCSEGSMDDTQFTWLKKEIANARQARQYVIVFSHHTLRTIRFPSTDATEYPMHYGQRYDRRNPANPQRPDGGETLEELFCRYENVIAHVAGHEHENYVDRYDCADDEPPPPLCVDEVTCPNPHFWHVSTAAHIDWPQQSRMIELIERAGRVDIVLTILDHAGAANPGSGQAPDDVIRLASIGREIAYNDYQASRGARGTRKERNVILPTDRPWPPPSAPPPTLLP